MSMDEKKIETASPDELAERDFLGKLEGAFRSNIHVAVSLRNLIHRLAEKALMRGIGRIVIMDFCGTHEWSIVHFGIRSLIPRNVELVAGPGCPVCVTPSKYIEYVVKLSFEGITVYTYGDAYRLKSLRPINGAYSLQEARSDGASVQVVTSFIDAIRLANTSGRESVFLGIGFETVAPGYAVAFKKNIVPGNLAFLSQVKLTPPAMRLSLELLMKEKLDYRFGVIAPGHVSTITGAKAWSFASEEMGIPVVIAGFEPIDVLIAIAEILRQIMNNESKTVIEYRRAVTWSGDEEAQRNINEVFTTIDDAWRGIGIIPRSGLELSDKYASHNAFEKYSLKRISSGDWEYDLPRGCKCGLVTLGKAKPTDCPLFMKACTPDRPIGPCMVSVEGTCSIWARFGGGGLADEVARSLEVY